MERQEGHRKGRRGRIEDGREEERMEVRREGGGG